MKRFLLFILIASMVALLTSACGGDSNSVAETGEFEVVGGTTDSSALGGPQSFAVYTPPDNSPTSVQLFIEQIWLGTNADCTDLALAIDKGGAAAYVEMTASPVLFDSSVASGTYNCMAIKMKDVIKFKANADAVVSFAECVDTITVYNHDILREQASDEYWYDPENIGTLTLAAGTSASPVAQDVFIYFTRSEADALTANSDLNPNQTLPLENPITISTVEKTLRKLWFYFKDKVVADGGACTLDSPEVGFDVMAPL